MTVPGYVGLLPGLLQELFLDSCTPHRLSITRDFKWSCECDKAFEAAKDLLCNSPVLAAPTFEFPFKLQVDACTSGAGAVLIQEDAHGVEHPVSYFPKKYNLQIKHIKGTDIIVADALSRTGGMEI